MKKMEQYWIYEVPIFHNIKTHFGICKSAPKCFKLGYRVVGGSDGYDEERGIVTLRVTIGGHNYLKKRKYAKLVEAHCN